MIFYRSPVKPHTVESPFDVSKLNSLPAVDLVRDYAGIDPQIADYFFNRPNAGLVVSSFAGGRMSQPMTDMVMDAAEGSKPIVISSGVKAGRIFGRYPGTSVIVASDLTPNKARILLMLALTQTQNPKEIQSFFDKF